MKNRVSYEMILTIIAIVLTSGIVIFNAFSSPDLTGPQVLYSNRNNDYSSSLSLKNTAVDEEPDDMTDTDEIIGGSPGTDGKQPDSDGGKESSKDSSGAKEKSGGGSTANPKELKIVNINTASVAKLANSLPGIGEIKAMAIVNYRTSHGPFKSVDELVLVNGIGDKTLAKLRPYVTIK